MKFATLERQKLKRIGGAGRDRTDGLVVANDALSQLSYSPKKEARRGPRWSYCNKALQAVPCLTVKRLGIAYASATSNWGRLQGASKLWPQPSLHISPTASSLAVSRYRTPWRCCSSRERALPASRFRQSPKGRFWTHFSAWTCWTDWSGSRTDRWT